MLNEGVINDRLYCSISIPGSQSTHYTWHNKPKESLLWIYRVPTRTGKTGKPGKMGRHFPVREKSGNFEQTGKVRERSGKTTQNTGKMREFQKKNICYFSMIFK